MFVFLKKYTMGKALFFLLVIHYLAFGQGNPDVKIYTLTDLRDKQKYRVIGINGTKWMASNLNYNTNNLLTVSSWCYDDRSSNCAKYGRLYTWEAAREACPRGWHLPSNEEWSNLTKAVVSRDTSTAGSRLKSRKFWNGSDDIDFSALPGGDRYMGVFGNAGANGNWWTSSTDSCVAGYAWSRVMSSNHEEVLIYCNDKSLYGYSVRCVED
jgi:uncharacterized protein (TIGR02145 family)